MSASWIDPVEGEVEARRELDRVALDGNSTGSPARRVRVTSVSGLPSPAAAQLGLGHVAAQDAEQAARLGERLPAGLLDGRIGPVPAPGPREQQPGGACLDGHDGDAVGDDVVQLAGDARPLCGDGRQRLGLTLVLEDRGRQLKVGLPLRAPAERGTRRARGRR